MLICSKTSTIGAPTLTYFFDDYMFRWSYAPTPICSNNYMPNCFKNFMLVPLDAPTLKCFDNRMHTSIDIHSYDIHAHVHTLGC